MTLLILFFLLSITFSFLCSIWEAVILSVTPKFINKLLLEGSSVGQKLQALKEDIDKPLSAILTLNTIAHTVGAIGVGAQAGEVFGSTEIDLYFFTVTGEVIVASVMTVAILILSEIIPKTIGANMWQQLAPFTVRSLSLLLFVLKPFVWISQLITKRLKKEKERSVLSRSDFHALAQEGEQSGAIDKNESKIIANLLRLDKLQVKDIMTPRSVMFSVDESMTVADFYEKHRSISFSRIPVYKEKSDVITGYLLMDRLLLAVADGETSVTIGDLKRDTVFVTDTDMITSLFETLLPTKKHMAIVNDSYGSVIGLITMEDVFETLLGMEIMDESDKVEDLQKHARNLWEQRTKN